MANPTTYMGIDLPVPLVTTGPQWAVALTAAFNVVDAHNHTFGSGSMLSPANNLALQYGGSGLSIVTKWADVGQTIKNQETTLSYTLGVLTSVVVTDYLNGVAKRTTTKTLIYTSGVLTSITIAVVNL